MLTLLLAACGARRTAPGPAPAGDYAVYSAALAALFPPADSVELAVDRRTWPGAADTAELRARLEWHRSRLAALTPDLVTEYVALASSPVTLGGPLRLGHPYRWVSGSPGAGRALVRWHVGLSRVAYSSRPERALVYVTAGCGPLCGSSEFVLLERREAGWEVIGRSQDAAS